MDVHTTNSHPRACLQPQVWLFTLLYLIHTGEMSQWPSAAMRIRTAHLPSLQSARRGTWHAYMHATSAYLGRGGEARGTVSISQHAQRGPQQRLLVFHLQAPQHIPVMHVNIRAGTAAGGTRPGRVDGVLRRPARSECEGGCPELQVLQRLRRVAAAQARRRHLRPTR